MSRARWLQVYVGSQVKVEYENLDNAPSHPTSQQLNLPLFAHGCVRDLAWAIFSPPLVTTLTLPNATVNAAHFVLTAQRRQWLLQLDHDPTPLQQFLQQSRHRFLGVYFEHLWRYFLQNDSEVTLLAHNCQIIEHGKTLGEFDILYHCHRRDITVHLELAVKFYLGMPITHAGNLNNSANWLGPNCADSLQQKLLHLRTHQLALIDQPAAQTWCADARIFPSHQEIAMHGYLYYPQELEPDAQRFAPADAGSMHASSFWLRDATLKTLLQSEPWSSLRHRLVPKLEWLCEHDPAAYHWLDSRELTGAISDALNGELNQPVMCESRLQDGSGNTQRYFVAPQDWPALHWPKRRL